MRRLTRNGGDNPVELTSFVKCSELSKHLAQPGLVIIDCRFDLRDPEAGRIAYRRGHIPGAYYADLNHDLSSPPTAHSGRHPLPDPSQFSSRLKSWGIDERTGVVVYDDQQGSVAARLWWLLRWSGVSNCAVLSEGWSSWLKDGYPTSKVEPAQIRNKRESHTVHVINEWVVDSNFIGAHAGDPSFCLIDVRSRERFLGLSEPIDSVAGHIPGALNLPLSELMMPTGVIKEPATLTEIFRGLTGSVTASNTIFTCGSGVTACYGLLAYAHSGAPPARLYAGSWSEWIRDSNRPIARGPHSDIAAADPHRRLSP